MTTTLSYTETIHHTFNCGKHFAATTSPFREHLEQLELKINVLLPTKSTILDN